MGSASSRSDWVSGTAAVATGVGMLTLALFPLAIPIVVLTIVATLPFALPLIAVAAIAAILIGAWRGLRAAGRGIRRLGGGPERTGASRARARLVGRDSLHGESGGAAATGPPPRLSDERI
jgi:hypothetical protein